MAEYSYSEDCCFNDPRDLCPLLRAETCVCACHDEPTVILHGRYAQGPMPAEFARALSELVRLVTEAYERGELGRKEPS